MDLATFNRLLAIGFEKGVSDIHFEVGYPPLFRARGQLIRSKLEPLTDKDTQSIAKIIIEQSRREPAKDFTEFDTSYSVSDIGRFRVSMFKQRHCLGIVMRAIPIEVRNVTELNLPPVIDEIIEAPRGLVLITGPTGNGKTTTMAAMIRHLNENHQYNIVTVEDPIEFLYPAGKSCIVQREVGLDTPNFSTAIRTAMRMDPDVLLVGELRDHETIDASLKAAETGHLVVSSLHTNNAATTVTRLMSYFAPEVQEIVRQRLADCLVATISLRLLSTINGDARIPAVEIMRTTPAIQACIREGRLADITKHIEKGREQYKMQTFDQHLLHLCQSNLVSLEEALQAASSSDLERNLTVTS